MSINSFTNIEDFNEITIRYIGTDDFLSDIWNSACSEDDIEEKWINATLSPSQEFVIKQDEGKKQQTMEEIVPLEYHEYLDVFQEEVECFPKARSWDHAVRLGFCLERSSIQVAGQLCNKLTEIQQVLEDRYCGP